jgi:hypothetical protein
MTDKLTWYSKPRSLAAAVALAVLMVAASLELPNTVMADESGTTHRASAAIADYCVAPDGKDTNPGTADDPFATLAQARDAVRKEVAKGLAKDIFVAIRGGTYPQCDTLTFGSEDSGTERHSITYAAWPGEEVIISGGRRITGWTKGQGEIWMADLPEVKAGNWRFRQLFVDGKRATRARTPNVDAKTPWWIIKTSAVSEQESQPFPVSVNGPVQAYKNPDDVELICIYNNEGGRKRLAAVDEKQQTITIAPPHRWNPRCFGADWYLSAPQPGYACYLENARAMLDQAGEWYLDRHTGVLYYWPRPGEDLTRSTVMAPVVQQTLLAVIGTHEKPVTNLHFRGLHVEYVDWPLPAWGYNGLFCCNVAAGNKEKPGHRFIEAAVEFAHARRCDFVDGRIAHVGANGLCLREGTAYNVIGGNEICDLGGNGIGAGGCNVAGGYLDAAPPPGQGEYKGYRIANNYIHHCGTDYYGGTGICLYLAQEAVVAHNLVHDVAYFGIGVAGSQDPKVPFAKNNAIEYNHVYRAMKVTVDGAGLYVTFAHYGRGTVVRGNLIHDTLWNTYGRGEVPGGIHDTIPCHGLYLDGNNTGCRYEWNVVYRNAGGPLLFNSPKSNNQWLHNLFQKEGTPPQEFLDVLELLTGLEPAYRRSIMKTETDPCNFHALIEDHSGKDRWAAYQFDRPQTGQGVVEIFCPAGSKVDSRIVPLRGLDTTARYDLKAYAGALLPADNHFYWGTFFGNCDKDLFNVYLTALGDLPILSNVVPLTLSAVGSASEGSKTNMSGRKLIDQGLSLKASTSPRVVWIVYRRAK